MFILQTPSIQLNKSKYKQCYGYLTYRHFPRRSINKNAVNKLFTFLHHEQTCVVVIVERRMFGIIFWNESLTYIYIHAYILSVTVFSRKCLHTEKGAKLTLNICCAINNTILECTKSRLRFVYLYSCLNETIILRSIFKNDDSVSRNTINRTPKSIP